MCLGRIRAIGIVLAILVGCATGVAKAGSCHDHFEKLRQAAQWENTRIMVYWTTNYSTNRARFLGTGHITLRLAGKDLVGQGTRNLLHHQTGAGPAPKIEDVSLRVRGDGQIVFQERYGPYRPWCSEGNPHHPFVIVDSKDSVEVMSFLPRAQREEVSWVSEETPPAICPIGYALASLKCAGSYCDNIGTQCTRYADPPAVPSSEPTYWTSWYSEEKNGDVLQGSNFPVLAHPNSVAVGLRCRGRYCDDLSLLIQPLGGANVPTLDSKQGRQCRLSQPYSEEGNTPYPRDIDYKEVIRRVGCSGRYCDNLQVEWCKVNKP